MMQGGQTASKKKKHSLKEDATIATDIEATQPAAAADDTDATARDAKGEPVAAALVELATAPPEYRRYVKLLAMGVSKETVFAKMSANSPELDPTVLGVAPVAASADDGADTADAADAAASSTDPAVADVSNSPESSTDEGMDEGEAVAPEPEPEPKPVSARARVVQAAADGHELEMTFAAHFVHHSYADAVAEVAAQEEAEHTAAERAQAKANAEMLRNRTGVAQNNLLHRYNERKRHRHHLEASLSLANQRHHTKVLAKLSRKHHAENAARDAEAKAAEEIAAASSLKEKHKWDVARHRNLEADRHVAEVVREASHYFEDVLDASSRIKEQKAHRKHDTQVRAEAKRQHTATDIRKARVAKAEAEIAAASKQAQAAKKKNEHVRLKALQREREQRQAAAAERKEAAKIKKEAAVLQAEDAKAKTAKANRVRLKKLQREHDERSKAHMDAKRQATAKALEAERLLQQTRKAEHMARITDNNRRFEKSQRERASHHIQAERAEELADLQDENELAEAEMEKRELETNNVLFGGYVKVVADKDRQTLFDGHKKGLLNQIHAARERRLQAERDCQLMTESVTNQAAEVTRIALIAVVCGTRAWLCVWLCVCVGGGLG